MKKGLSVLLIAAALFGFYGGAVNLNDVLACKDYWEEEGEKSTADMNKLEDGLNQLKDNEQAYLDGLDAVAEGEEALAQGEQDYADGQATLAKGEADYAAAPGKLADARKQIAAGEDALDEGQDSIDGLTKLINGIKKILTGYSKEWRPGYEKLKDGRNQLYKGSKGSKADLTALAVFLAPSSQSAYVGAVNDVAADDEKQTAKDYKDFIKSTNTMAKSLPEIQKNVAALTSEALRLYGKLSAIDNNADFAQAVAAEASALHKFDPLIPANLKDTYVNGIDNTVEKVKQMPSVIKENVIAQMNSDDVKTLITSKVTEQMGSAEVKQQIADLMAKGLSEEEATEKVKESVKESVKAAVQEDVTNQVTKKVIDATNADPENTANRQKLVMALGMLYNGAEGVKGLKEVNESVNGDGSAIKNTLLPGLKKFNAAATDKAIDKLTSGQDTIADGVRTVASAVLGNSTLKNGVKDAFGADALALLRTYASSPNTLSSKLADYAKFEAQMDKTPGIKAFLEKANKLLRKTKAEGLKTLNAGKKKLASGKAQYAKGLADYKAAPAKLAAGRAQLAEGLQKLMDGRKELAAGKEKLAEYEDGEQQVRDGLATLMGTEANGGLDSILDRRSGDDDFDNGDEHLDLDEGLDAVDVGRGYQADSGELITKEITNRAIGTAAGLGAGALAVLAAILSFLKKNKGSGVCALLSAAAGGAGIAAGTSAGTEFSSIAGSAVGATPWIAFGILAGVALIHAIAHFATKEA